MYAYRYIYIQNTCTLHTPIYIYVYIYIYIYIHMYAFIYVYTEYLYTTHPQPQRLWINKSSATKKMSIATQSLNIRSTYIECVRFDMIWGSGKKVKEKKKWASPRNRWTSAVHISNACVSTWSGQRGKSHEKKENKVTCKRDMKRYLLNKIVVCLGQVSLLRCLWDMGWLRLVGSLKV